MLGLDKFRWIFKAQPAAVPGFKAIATPRGYHPPKIMDVHMDPATGGYRLGTVRTWADGPHIKLNEGWYPYDTKTGYIRNDDGKWVHVNQHIGDAKPLPEHSKYHITRGKVGEAGLALMDIQRNAGDTVPQKDKDTIKHIYEGVSKFLESVADGEKVGRKLQSEAEYLLEDMYHDLDDQVQGIDDETDPAAVGKIAHALSKHLSDDLMTVIDKFHKLNEKRLKGSFHTDVKMDETKYPELSTLTKPVKDMKPIGAQGNVSITQLRELEDGSKTIFKHDVLAAPMARFPRIDADYGYARREVAAYVLNKMLGFDVVPPTTLVSEPVFDPRLVDEELPKRFAWAGFDESEAADIDPYEAHEGSVQKFIAGQTMDEMGLEVPENANIEALHKILVLDELMSNSDRHEANLMFDEEGNPWAIDHGICFGTGVDPILNVVRAELDRLGEKDKIPDSVIKAVLDIDDQEVYDTMSELVGDRDTSSLHDKLLEIKSRFGKIQESRKKKSFADIVSRA